MLLAEKSGEQEKKQQDRHGVQQYIEKMTDMRVVSKHCFLSGKGDEDNRPVQLVVDIVVTFEIPRCKNIPDPAKTLLDKPVFFRYKNIVENVIMAYRIEI